MRRFVAVPLLLTLLGGCTVTVDRTARTSELADRWRREQRVQLDLTTPLDRARAGFAERTSTLPLQARPGSRIDVELTLPGGELLEVPATSLVIDAALSGQPSRVAIGRVESQEQGLLALREEVERFGFDRELFERLVRDVTDGGADANGTVGEVLLEYLRVEIEGRQQQSDGTVSLVYSLSWDAAG